MEVKPTGIGPALPSPALLSESLRAEKNPACHDKAAKMPPSTPVKIRLANLSI